MFYQPVVVYQIGLLTETILICGSCASVLDKGGVPAMTE
jgi:hypothetical protein